MFDNGQLVIGKDDNKPKKLLMALSQENEDDIHFKGIVLKAFNTSDETDIEEEAGYISTYWVIEEYESTTWEAVKNLL